MAYFSLKLVQQRGTASVMLRDGTTVKLFPNKKFIFEIENPTMEDIKFYRNYRTLGIVFCSESVESGNKVNNEVKPETSNTTQTPETDSSSTDAPAQVSTLESDTTEQEKELMKKTKPELLAMAKEGNVEVDESFSKQEIVNKLLGK